MCLVSIFSARRCFHLAISFEPMYKYIVYFRCIHHRFNISVTYKGDFMRVYFWGTRGSLPAAATSQMTHAKIFKAIKASRSHKLKSDKAIETFIHRNLPFSVRGSYGGNTSCIEIRGQEEYVLCDAGTGLRDFGNHILKSGDMRRRGPTTVFHIFISHPHWDHIQGFPFFTPAYMPGNRVNIYGCHIDLEQSFITQQNPANFPVSLKDMNGEIVFHTLEPDKTYDIAGIEVKGILQNHPGDSYGYCFLRDGKKVVYSTDAEHKMDADDDEADFLDFTGNADLLIFDAQYTLADAIGAKENWGHSSNLVAVDLAVKAGVKHLCLYHSEHTYDDENLDQFLEDTRAYLNILAGSYPLKIDLAYDGLEIEV